MITAILGGGLTGLTLGYLLHDKGINFEILEREPECGGLMRSLRDEGFTFDYGGSHIIFSKDTVALDFMLKLLGENKLKNRRNTKVLYKGHYVKYPFENGLSDLPKHDNFECVMSFIQNLIQKEKGESKKPSNLREWCYFTFGKGIAEKYLIPYNEKIWKYPLENMSLEWVERIPNPPVEDVIKSSLGIQTEGYTHQLYFYYPREGGIQAVTKSLEAEIGDHIIKNFDVKKVNKNGEKWLISDGKEARIYDKIISTIPIVELVDVVDASRDVKKAVGNLRCNSLITVMIGLDAPNVNDYSWLYVPAKDILTHRISFPSNFSPSVVPEGKSSILGEITCNVGDAIWKLTDEEIVLRVITDLEKLAIIEKINICFTKVKRLKYAYVINDLNYRKNKKIVGDYFKNEGIDLVGRFSEFKYLNMDMCIRSAIDYATGKQIA
jgi:protoporphyrinogen oxidase